MDATLIATIHDLIIECDKSGIVNLGHYIFDRVPCSKRTLYAIVRKHAREWGYRYESSEYIPSGNRPFQRNHKRGQYRNPYIRKLK